MNEREYNDQSITDYLLGSLPEEQAERFDELSFIDEEFSDALKRVENDLIDAYIRNELSGAALEKFKNHYLSSPLRREKVRFAESLQIYAERNDPQKVRQLAKTTEVKPKEKKGFFAAWEIFANPAFALSTAGIILIFTVLGGFWLAGRTDNRPDEIAQVNVKPTLSNQPLPEQTANLSAIEETANNNINAPPPASEETTKKTPSAVPSQTPKPERTVTLPKITTASFILTPPLRGSQIQTISFPKGTVLIMMSLKTESNDYKAYRVELVDDSNRKLFQPSGSAKIRNELINVSFPANLVVKPGFYSLIVSGIKDDGEAEIISNYPFKTVLR